MSDLASRIKSLESAGFSTEEAKVEAKAERELAERERERERAERERERAERERERAERERERACELFYCYFILVLFHYQIFQTIWNMTGSSWNRSYNPE